MVRVLVAIFLLALTVGADAALGQQKVQQVQRYHFHDNDEVINNVDRQWLKLTGRNRSAAN